MSKVLTDNSYLEEKVRLRLDNLPLGMEIRVLDMFHGDGLIWKEVQQRTTQKINVLGIDRSRDRRGLYLIRDNRKFNFSYGSFHVVDMDAYGVPFTQLEKLLRQRSLPKVVFITFIQRQWGALPDGLLRTLGYTKAMVDKIPTLFYRDGQAKLLHYLSMYGAKHCHMACQKDRRKSYLSIEFC